jgi:hypothetical protein
METQIANAIEGVNYSGVDGQLLEDIQFVFHELVF